MKEKLRAFLLPYIHQDGEKKDWVLQEDVDMFVDSVVADGVEQNVIDYGTAHPEASFWDFLNLLKPGLFGVTQEELLSDDE